MSNEYQYTPVTGASWLRAKRIVVDNPLDGVPNVKFVEEKVVNIGISEQYRKDAGVLSVDFSPGDLDMEIPLVNPETNEPLGQSMTHAQAQVLLHSAYIHFAQMRDAPPVPSSTDEPPVEEGTAETSTEEPTDG